MAMQCTGCRRVSCGRASPVLHKHCLGQPVEATPLQCDVRQPVQQHTHFTAPASQQLGGRVAGRSKAQGLEALQDALWVHKRQSTAAGLTEVFVGSNMTVAHAPMQAGYLTGPTALCWEAWWFRLTCSVVLGSPNSLGDGRVMPHSRSSHTACARGAQAQGCQSLQGVMLAKLCCCDTSLLTRLVK